MFFFSLAILCLKNYNSTAFQAWLMLLHASVWFVYFPTGIKKEFREQVRNVPTDPITKFIMNLVHLHDSEENACPSMHCAFAVFLAFITFPFYPILSIAFPIVVALSCLFTKQHLMVDILPGFLLGALHGAINSAFLI
jgi:membrane-associated phospholipid phosphatase